MLSFSGLKFELSQCLRLNLEGLVFTALIGIVSEVPCDVLCFEKVVKGCFQFPFVCSFYAAAAMEGTAP